MYMFSYACNKYFVMIMTKTKSIHLHLHINQESFVDALSVSTRNTTVKYFDLLQLFEKMLVHLAGSATEALVFNHHSTGIIKVDITGNFGMFYCRFLIKGGK